jgi:hypothetical protein
MRNASDSYLRRSLEEIVPDFDSPGRAALTTPNSEVIERSPMAMGAAHR